MIPLAFLLAAGCALRHVPPGDPASLSAQQASTLVGSHRCLDDLLVDHNQAVGRWPTGDAQRDGESIQVIRGALDSFPSFYELARARRPSPEALLAAGLLEISLQLHLVDFYRSLAMPLPGAATREHRRQVVAWDRELEAQLSPLREQARARLELLLESVDPGPGAPSWSAVARQMYEESR